jgi:hypothetical protein
MTNMQNKLDDLINAAHGLLCKCDCWAASDDRQKVKDALAAILANGLWEPIETAPKTSEWIIVIDGPMVVTAYWECFNNVNQWVMLDTCEIIYPTKWLNIRDRG